MIYLDNAATSGFKPKIVQEAVSFALRNYSANPGRSGHRASFAASEAIYKCREKVANFFGANGAENVIFTKNCTEAINYVIKGVLSVGDHVVVSSLEHNSVMRPLETLRSRHQISYDIAEVMFEDDDATVRAFDRAITSKTKLVICTHASNVLGNILPIQRIANLCKQKNILFAVDAAQSAGVLPIDMNKMQIDYLFVAPHKGLYAPMGTGILIACKPIRNTLIEGGTGSDSVLLIQKPVMPEGFESGTINVPGILGISAGIDFVKSRDMKKIYQHELELIRSAYEGLKLIAGTSLYMKKPEMNYSVPVLSFNIRHMQSSRVAEYLDNNNIAVRSGMHCAPSAHKRIGTLENGTVRVSTGYFNTMPEIMTFLKTIKQIKS